MLTACGPGTQSGIDPRLGVSASPRVAQDGEPIAEGGGTYKLGKPYKVAGRWYEPKHNPEYDQVGRASWYGSAFHGRRTANGEVFNKEGLTAAHPTLPLPSYVRVTNLENGRSVVVRVNDRGPFGHGRIIDVSRRTAELLDFKQNGTAGVRVQYVDLAPVDGSDHAFLLASFQAPGGRRTAEPTMAAYAGQGPNMRDQEALDSALVATGAPFDPYRALTEGGVARRAKPPHSSYARNTRISAAFHPIGGLER